MGRNVKRVHVDFDWFEKTSKDGGWADNWKGYVMDEIECPLCDGTGITTSGTQCPVCCGEGKTNPRIEPPKGYDFEKTDGYQVWQDVSEGSPVSPVFLKPEDLAKWMVDNDTSVTKGTSYEGWLGMIEQEGESPSMVGSITGGMKPGTSLYEPSDVVEKEKENE